VRGFPVRGQPLRLDLASLVGPVFWMWVIQLLLPVSARAALGRCTWAGGLSEEGVPQALRKQIGTKY
jgi:hypothetical protein